MRTTHRLTVYNFLRSWGWTVRAALARCYRPQGPRITLYGLDIENPVEEPAP